MKWTEIESDNYLVRYNFADGFYRREPAVIDMVQPRYEADYINIECGDYSLHYLPNADYEFRVDVTELLQLVGSGTLMITDSTGVAYELAFETKGDMSIDNVDVPPVSGVQSVAPVVLPFRVLRSGSLPLYITSTAARVNGGAVAVGWQLVSCGGGVSVSGGGYEYRTRAADGGACRHRYARIKWLFPYCNLYAECGIEVSSETMTATNKTEMQSVLGRVVRKGLSRSMELRLDGLTRYDYWYYSTIAMSSDVRVELGDGTKFGDECQVEVTSSAKQQSADGLFELVITIQFKEYGIA